VGHAAIKKNKKNKKKKKKKKKKNGKLNLAQKLTFKIKLLLVSNIKLRICALGRLAGPSF
jgi:hypothetical protein